VGEHPRQLLGIAGLHQAAGDRDRGVVRIAAGREGVRLAGLQDVDLGHGQIRVARQLLDQAEQLRRLGPRHLPRIVHAQHHLVRVPVCEPVHGECYDERDQQPAFARQKIADRQEQAGHGGQKKTRAYEVHRSPPAN
jgi:hypothetical protein